MAQYETRIDDFFKKTQEDLSTVSTTIYSRNKLLIPLFAQFGSLDWRNSTADYSYSGTVGSTGWVMASGAMSVSFTDDTYVVLSIQVMAYSIINGVVEIAPGFLSSSGESFFPTDSLSVATMSTASDTIKSLDLSTVQLVPAGTENIVVMYRFTNPSNVSYSAIWSRKIILEYL